MTQRITTLDEGLTIATDRVQGARSVAIGVWVGVGSRDEPAELSGVSHFLEHLLFKGTPLRTAQDISRSIDRIGGDINAFTAKEFTSYYCRVPARHTAFGIELLGDVLTHSNLDDDDVESERQVILEELAMDDDAPDDVAMRMLSRAIFADHGLGRDTAGDRQTVTALTADAVREFFARRYTTETTVVSIAGDIDHDDVVGAVATAFADLPAGSADLGRVAPTQSAAGAHLSDDTEQVHLALGGRGLPRQHPDREALDVVNHVFGGGLSSRLFEEIRERRGLAYTVYSSLSAYSDAGAWNVYAGAMPAHAATVYELVLAELDRLATDGIDGDELDVAVGYLTGAYEMGLEDTAARMSRLGGMLVTGREVRSVEEQLARWEAVTVADTRRAIESVYAAADPITVTVGPE